MGPPLVRQPSPSIATHADPLQVTELLPHLAVQVPAAKVEEGLTKIQDDAPINPKHNTSTGICKNLLIFIFLSFVSIVIVLSMFNEGFVEVFLYLYNAMKRGKEDHFFANIFLSQSFHSAHIYICLYMTGKIHTISVGSSKHNALLNSI